MTDLSQGDRWHGAASFGAQVWLLPAAGELSRYEDLVMSRYVRP